MVCIPCICDDVAYSSVTLVAAQFREGLDGVIN